MLAMAHGAAEKRVSASPFVGLPGGGGLTAPAHADALDGGGLTAPAHADALDRQTFSQR